MSALIIAVIALIAFGLALYPLFRQEPWAFALGARLDSNLENLLSAREATYSAIKDLESDHAQGKLSDVDYQTLRAKYEAKAISILQELDLLETGLAKTPSVTATNGQCAQCGEAFAARDKFCRRCGARLAALCPSCGEPSKVGTKFCARCGTPVSVFQAA